MDPVVLVVTELDGDSFLLVCGLLSFISIPSALWLIPAPEVDDNSVVTLGCHVQRGAKGSWQTYSTVHRAVVSLRVYRYRWDMCDTSSLRGQEYIVRSRNITNGDGTPGIRSSCLQQSALFIRVIAWNPVYHREIDRLQLVKMHLFLPGCQDFKPFHFLSVTWVSQCLTIVQSTGVDNSK